MGTSLCLALLLSLIAGLSTTIGSAIAFVMRKPSGRTLSLILGFSAGVMIAVSFVELLGRAIGNIGMPRAAIAFFVGFGVIFLIDVLVPHEYEAEIGDRQSAALRQAQGRRGGDPERSPGAALRRAGLLTALGIAIHNFPEGFAVFAGAAESLKLGALLTIAIAVHNIPEGVAVSVPIFAATGNARQAFWYSFASGIVEPIGALVGALILWPWLNEAVVSHTLAAVGGIMVIISLDELLPTAHQHGEEHSASLGVLAGMIVMVGTLMLLK